MYRSAYKKLSWGMIFIAFNINLGPINILPNFIGYLLILSGLSILSEQLPVFEKGKLPAGILALITLKDIVNFGAVDLLKGGFYPGSIWTGVIGAVEEILLLYLVYIICKGIYLGAEGRGLQQLMDTAKGRFYFFLVIDAIVLFFTPFLMNLSREVSTFLLIFVLLRVVTALFIIGLCRMARNELVEGESF